MSECIQKEDEMFGFNNAVDEAVWKIVFETTKQLTGKKQLEDEVKKAMMPQTTQAAVWIT